MTLEKAKLKRIFSVMLPILFSQLAIIGMQVFDVAMSGHAGSEELAGSSVGSSIIMPIIGGTLGFLTAATPIIAQLVGKKEHSSIGSVVKTGIFLALCLEALLLILYFFFIDYVLSFFTLTDYVHNVAKYYILAVLLGMSFGLMTFPMRSLIETVISTKLAMKIYLLALPINALLNYTFIFGHFYMPKMGGIGAGIATAITYFFIFLIFISLIIKRSEFKNMNILKGEVKKSNLKEYISLGAPNSLSIFVEASIFGFILVFVSKFGILYTAAHQIAMNIASVCYMIPLSFSLALTIIVGIEVGAKRYFEAKKFIFLTLKISFVCSSIIAIILYLAHKEIALLYTKEETLLLLIPQFLFYVIIWQISDSITTPILGGLRGYKDIKMPSCINLIAYWLICLPLGLFMDIYFNHGAFSYWQSLVIGINAAGIFFIFRLIYIQKKYSM